MKGIIVNTIVRLSRSSINIPPFSLFFKILNQFVYYFCFLTLNPSTIRLSPAIKYNCTGTPPVLGKFVLSSDNPFFINIFYCLSAFTNRIIRRRITICLCFSLRSYIFSNFYSIGSISIRIFCYIVR